MADKKYYTITEALGKINEHTPMSKKSLYNHINKGKINVVGEPYHRKIHIDEINRYLKDNYLL
jgi:hypothetical protein